MSLKEILIKALMDTLMGMGTVFAILILISFIIYLFKVFATKGKKPEDSANSVQPAAATDDAAKNAIQNLASSEEPDDEDDEIAAVITAAIMAYRAHEAAATNTALSFGTGYNPGGWNPGENYVVRSIKRRR